MSLRGGKDTSLSTPAIVLPEAISLDGATDYLSRASDFVGNVDSKTFTFSCFEYHVNQTVTAQIPYATLNNRFMIQVTDNTLYVLGYNSSGTLVLNANCPISIENTSANILTSIDMDTQANCKIYINDVAQSITFSTFTAGQLIDFTEAGHKIGTNGAGSANFVHGRLSHLFLDYTYRDLSIEANRRLFITAEGKPPATKNVSIGKTPDITPQDYIAYYPLTGTAEDKNGNYDGIENGGLAYVDDATMGSVADLDGVNDYIDTGYTSTETISCSLWVKATGASGFMVSDTDNTGSSSESTFAIAANNASFYYFVHKGTNYTISSNLYDGNWHNIVIILTATTIKSYIDGTIFLNTTLTTSNTNGTRSIKLGRLGDYNGFYFNGNLSKVRFYTKELTAQEVTNIYNYELVTRPIPASDGLVAYYPLKNNSLDNYFNQHDGTDVSVTYDGTEATIGTSITFPSASGFVEMSYILNGVLTFSDVEINVFNSGTLSDVRKYNKALTKGEKYELSTLDADHYVVKAIPDLIFESPLFYFPMTDASTAHINAVPNGNMLQNGLIETADRGANQGNMVQSAFEGATVDNIENTTTFADSKQITASLSFKVNSLVSNSIIELKNGTLGQSKFYIETRADGGLRLLGRNTANTTILYVTYPLKIVAGVNYTLDLSIDLTNVAKRHVILQGTDITEDIAWTTYTDDSLAFATCNTNKFGVTTGTVDLELGEVYIDTAYIDLGADNSFIDSTTLEHRTAREVQALLGSNPKFVCPISADNPTANYGSIGAMTLNGGGLTGARGASEYIARSAKSDGTTGYFSGGALSGAVDSKTFSLVFAVYVPAVSSFSQVFNLYDGVNDGFRCEVTPSENLQFLAYNSVGTLILNAQGSALVTDSWNIVTISADLADSLKRSVTVNRVSAPPTWFTYTDDLIDFTKSQSYIMGYRGAIQADIDQPQAFTYFTTEYIDFLDEATYNKVVNQLSFPRDIEKEIDDGNIPTPFAYLPFDDTANLGKNVYGTDFTVVGTVTAGADFAI